MALARLQENWQQLGACNGTLYTLDRLLDKLSRGRIRFVRFQIVAQPVPPRGSNQRTPRGKLVVRQASSDDPIVAAFPRPAGVIERRFANEATCFVATIDGKFAGFLWLEFHHYDEDVVRCRYRLPEAHACAWDYDVYVEPQYRLGRAFSRLWDAANQHMAERGIKWSISRISAFNSGSIAVHHRLGMITMFPVNFLVAGPLQLTFLRRYPFLHLSMIDSSPPSLPIRAPSNEHYSRWLHRKESSKSGQTWPAATQSAASVLERAKYNEDSKTAL